MSNRRRVPRQPADYRGSCHIEGVLPEWRDCEIVDISRLGLGIRIRHSRPAGLVGRRVRVQVPEIGHSVEIQLDGEIRHVGEGLNGTVHVGMEFDKLTETERDVVDMLTRSYAIP